jgi:hypothetical protein
MRPQEGRRYDDEAFYFDGPELIIDEACLEGPYPSVETFDSRTLITTYEDSEGRWIQRDTSGLDIIPFYPGERMIGLQTSDEWAEQRWDDSTGEFNHILQGEPTKTYDVQPDDRILVRHTGFGKRRREPVVILPVPAGEHLPTDEFYYYRAFGIITAEDRLVAWGNGASHVEWLLDLAIASWHVEDHAGLYQLEQQVGTDELVGLIGASATLATYLQDFAERYGRDFTPSKNPKERRGEFPKQLTKAKLTERYGPDYRSWPA